MSVKNSNDFLAMYEDLGIDPNDLGCIMLDTENIVVSDVIPEAALFLKEDDPDSHTQGNVSEKEPHVTLLYGLLRSGPELKKHVDTLLNGWEPQDVEIESVDFFPAKNGEDYVVIVARLKVTDSLTEANGLLRLLPHIDTFAEYHPHITLAYVKTTADWEYLVSELGKKLNGTTIKALQINYGD